MNVVFSALNKLFKRLFTTHADSPDEIAFNYTKCNNNMDRSININFEFIVYYEDGTSKIADINAESFSHACLRFFKRDKSTVNIIGFKMINR